MRLTPEQVRDALNSRCDTVKVVHCAFDKVRLHHEIETPPDLLICHAFDYSLLGTGVVPALNALKRGEALLPGATVLPAAARVWAVGVRVLPEMGVPVHMAATEQLFWSPVARPVDLDHKHWRRTLQPVTAAACVLGFDFRADAPPIKPERRPLDLRVTADGPVNAIVFWYELHLGDGEGGVLSTAPSAALPDGATRLQLGQAMQFVPPQQVAPGESLRLAASHNRHRILFEPIFSTPVEHLRAKRSGHGLMP